MIRVRLLAAALALGVPAAAMAAGPVIVHRDPGCGCCTAWAKCELKREVKIVDDPNRPAFAHGRGVPHDLGSCNTAVIDGMTFEGHVPIADIKRVLAEQLVGLGPRAGILIAIAVRDMRVSPSKTGQIRAHDIPPNAGICGWIGPNHVGRDSRRSACFRATYGTLMDVSGWESGAEEGPKYPPKDLISGHNPKIE